MPVVVLVPLPPYQDSSVRLRQAENPEGIGVRVGGMVRVVIDPLSMRLEYDAVPVGVLVVGGTAAPEGDDAVRFLPSAPCDHPVVREPYVIHFGSGFLLPRGGIEPDDGPGAPEFPHM